MGDEGRDLANSLAHTWKQVEFSQSLAVMAQHVSFRFCLPPRNQAAESRIVDFFHVFAEKALQTNINKMATFAHACIRIIVIKTRMQ